MSPTSHAPQAAPVTYTAPSISTEFSENEYRMAHTSGNNTDKGRVAWIHRYLGDGPLKNTVAGAAAGCVSGVITCPLDVVKTRLQHQALVKHQSFVPYKGSINTLRRIFNEEGIRGLYRGLTPMLIGYLPTWAIYFPTYEGMKSTIVKYTDSSPTSPHVHILSAMVAGAGTSAATNPVWILKTRFMTQTQYTNHYYTGILDAVRQIYSTEGIKGFYKGLGISLVGVTHVAVQFPLYERIKLMLKTDTDKLQSLRILLASALSKIIASTITYPHEVIRTRLQNQTIKPFKYKGIVHAAITIRREEGWRGFYHGMGANMLRTVPASMMTLLTFEALTRIL